MDFNIHYSGSAGNCATLVTEDNIKIMIDAGMPYSKIKQHLDGVEVLLYTHRHGDHLGRTKSTYNQIRINHPYVTIIGNEDTNQRLLEWGMKPLDVIIDDSASLWLNETEVIPVENNHDVECYGFIIIEPNQEVTLFATDLSTVMFYESVLDKRNLKIDNLLLEANYDPSVVGFMEWLQLHTGFDAFNNGSERHLPVDEWNKMREEYCKPNAKVEQLHISETYHSFNGLAKKFDFNLEDVRKWTSIYKKQQ